MTTHINRGDKFLGYPATKLKAMLTSWAKGTKDPYSLACLAPIKLTPAAVTAFLGECYDRGYITLGVSPEMEPMPDRDRFRHAMLSPSGLAITSASAKKRSSKEAAAKVLEQLLKNAQALAGDENAVTDVSKIWVFGSYIDQAKQDVGDLDIVIERRTRPVWERRSFEYISEHIAKYYPTVVPTDFDPLYLEEHWFKRMIFGARRHHLIAENDIGTLKKLYRPCRLVFDLSRGGIIQPVDFPNHPESFGRANTINDRLEMPDLTSAKGDFQFISAELFGPKYRPRYTRQEVIITSKSDLPKNVANRLSDLPIDGRRHFAILVTSGDRPDALLYVTRKVEFYSAIWDYSMDVKCLSQSRNADLAQWGAYRGSELISNLFHGDTIRLANRRATYGGFEGIYAELTLDKRTEKIPELTEKLQHFYSIWFSDPEYSNLPENQRFGVDVDICGFGGGYVGPLEMDDEDWSADWAPPFTREEYRAWLERVDPKALTELPTG